MPIVENDTEDEIEYRVNDDGREEGLWTEIEGHAEGTLSYEGDGKKYHQIQWVDGTTQWVPNDDHARQYHSSAHVIIKANREIVVEKIAPPSGTVTIENQTEHTIKYYATIRSPIYNLPPKKEKDFSHEGWKFHQIRRSTDADFKNIADRRLPSDITVTISDTDIKIEPPIDSFVEPAEAVLITS